MALTSIVDMNPLVELALIRHGVEVAALDVSEAGLVRWAGVCVADLKAPALPDAVLPPIPRPEAGDTAVGRVRKDVAVLNSEHT